MLVLKIVAFLVCFLGISCKPTSTGGNQDELFEGDIILNPFQRSATWDPDMKSAQRNAIINVNKLWPNGIVPYTIAEGFTTSEKKVIAQAMSEYHTQTCVRFIPRKLGDEDYIRIMKGNGCYSYVARQGGEQQVSLGGGCVYFGIVVHELMHALGFWHEQSREDRDKHIRIVWDNIKKGRDNNFKKYSWKYIQDLGESYDLSSVMHYGAYAFALDRSRPTIVALNKIKGRAMGQRNGFSNVDIRKINSLYECNEGGSGEGEMDW